MIAPARIVSSNSHVRNTDASFIREGSVVSGKVLSKNSDGTYVVSVAGKQVQVQARTDLNVGAKFLAKVKLQGNQISLILQNTENTINSDAVIKLSSSGKENLSSFAKEFLNSLGLPQNPEVLRLVQFLQQMGMKIDPQYIRKLLGQAKNRKESDTEKNEAEIILDSKNLDTDDSSVLAVTRSFERRDEGNKNPNDGKPAYDETAENIIDEPEASDIKDYFAQVDYRAENYAQSQIGILTKFNSTKNDRKKSAMENGWLIFPFEWNFNEYFGDFRVFFEDNFRILKKLIINCENKNSKRTFVVYYKNKKISSVKFSCCPEMHEKERASACELLMNFIKRQVSLSELESVEYVPFELLHGFGQEDSEISIVRGEA